MRFYIVGDVRIGSYQVHYQRVKEDAGILASSFCLDNKMLQAPS